MRAALVALALVGCVGCVDQGAGPQPKKIEPGYVGKHLLRAAPTLAEPVNVTLGGQVVYLGSTVDSARVAPGATVKVKHFWKVLAPPGPGWRVFTLLQGAPNTPDYMNLPVTDMQLAHGPATWRAGEIIEDEQDIVVRPDWRSAEATLLVGLIAVGEHGTLDRMAATGANVRDRAVISRVLSIDLSKAPPPPGTVYLQRARGAITVDGVANDPGWVGAVASPDFATAEGSPEPVGKATARMVWDDDHLYVFATVTDTDIISEFKKHDDTLWKADVIEMFIDADSTKRGYVELQVNPNNATFDKWFPGTRSDPGDDKWDSAMVTAVKMIGSAEPGDNDASWEVEIAIPWAAVKGRDDAMKVRLPPAVGDRWRMNIVRGDKKTGANVAAASWNRISYADWHAIDRMLTVVFADTVGGVVPNAPADPRLAPPAPVVDGAGSGSALPLDPALRPPAPT